MKKEISTTSFVHLYFECQFPYLKNNEIIHYHTILT